MSKEKLNFLGLAPEAISYEKATVVILPVPLEKTTSYEKGTKNGPFAIVEASHQVEFCDNELQKEFWEPGIHTHPAMDFEGLSSKEALVQIEEKVDQLLRDQKFPILLGGEHSLTAGSVASVSKKHPNLSLLQIDAHADLREEYEGNSLSHACAMRCSLPYVKKIVGVGIRSVAKEELLFAKEHPEITLFFDHELRKKTDWIQKAIHSLTDIVYLSIDVDGFDPSLVPATGTPEPGGLSWYEGLDLLRALFQNKTVVACDIVELKPDSHSHVSNFFAAKLAYKLISYWKHFGKMSLKQK